MEVLKWLTVLVHCLLIIASVRSLNIPDVGSCKALVEAKVKSGLIGAYIPQCNPDGYYLPLQCDASTGFCWCSDKLGKGISGDAIKSTDCNNPCFKHILDNLPPSILIQGAPRPINLIVPQPTCDMHGFYAAKQCNDKEQCWCVSKMGKQIRKVEYYADKSSC